MRRVNQNMQQPMEPGIDLPEGGSTFGTFGDINIIGLWTLYCKEVWRFLKVVTQTVMAPVITTLIFLAIFTLALGRAGRMVGDLPFLEFLAPGLIMMAIVQNAFANTSSSIMIAKVQGMATAAGCQLVAMCDMAAASRDARFAVSGVNFGLFCATPSVALSRNIGRKAAFEMLVTGEFIDADAAMARGLVNSVTAPEQLDAAVEQWVQAILSKPRIALALGKSLFYRQLEKGIAAAYTDAAQTMACNMMDETALEGVQAFIEKRRPDWRG